MKKNSPIFIQKKPDKRDWFKSQKFSYVGFLENLIYYVALNFHP